MSGISLTFNGADAIPSTPDMKHHKKSKSMTVLPTIRAALPRENDDRIVLGICAMDKKARSKPMAEILSRLDDSQFHIIFFGDDAILNQPVEDWPRCRVMIAFYSKGYPLGKVREYVALRRPFILNDLDMQGTLKDRRKVYDLLEASGIDVPRHVYLSRDGYISNGTGDGNKNFDQDVIEFDDHIEVNGVTINKPFVEKPVDADDHNIAIYYPSSAGGGCKKLFRKIGNRSSEFYPDINEVRRDGSYIYEEFVETQGTDVKMYTVGPEYGHAEARKSPAVDGKVERNSDGKELRFPVILTLREKEIARRIVLGFKQWVCGFDLLRVQEGDSLVSYVCDVNGWSFVKNSRYVNAVAGVHDSLLGFIHRAELHHTVAVSFSKYYDDCAQILTEHMLAMCSPNSLRSFSTLNPLVTTNVDLDEKNVDLDEDDQSYFPVLRRVTGQLHKNVSRILQNAKSDVPPPPEDDAQSATSNSVSAATTLEDGAVPVREIPHTLASEPASMSVSRSESFCGSVSDGNDSRNKGTRPFRVHQEELRCVIAVVRHGDRTPKQKLKINTSEIRILDYFAKHANNCRKELKVKDRLPMIEFLETVTKMIAEKQSEGNGAKTKLSEKDILYKLLHMRDVLERWRIVGLNRKLQIKPRSWEEYTNAIGDTQVRCVEVQLILKWGGNLTKLGEKQAVNLGQRLRHELYPDASGGGILRLHSTFRHDLKIKTSDEGRVMKTAAAFAKGLLELEGDLPPILVSLVHKEKDSQMMLDPSGNNEVKIEQDECKENINRNLQRDLDFDAMTSEEHEEIVGPACLGSLHRAFQNLGNPRKTLFKIRSAMGELLEQLEEMLDSMASGDENVMEGGEGLKGDNEEDQALSGVKLYKGESLLELTERWRFIYNHLYDEDKDFFDLSRIPEIHDNVRFDMLHNPHLGLTNTLEKLYKISKEIADCVVPQEYGTTLREKRSISSKMCRALLEKIKFDLIIARTDNQADMRYMINMDYGSDLPINTMGRRIRTRLYFTSESHMHTMLNVLRFGGMEGQPCPLSKAGNKIISNTPELCYLTQIVLRLFEDSRRPADDPRRFRVEILFSPGATATPMHMAELERDSDASRFDTEGLKMIGREGLTCQEVEDYFTTAMACGKTEDDDEPDFSVSTMMDDFKKKETAAKKEKESKKGLCKNFTSCYWPSRFCFLTPCLRHVHSVPHVLKTIKSATGLSEAAEEGGVAGVANDAGETVVTPPDDGSIFNKEEIKIVDVTPKEFIVNTGPTAEALTKEDDDNKDDLLTPRARSQRLSSRQEYWRNIAIGSIILGMGCIWLSQTVQQQRRYGRYNRRYSR